MSTVVTKNGMGYRCEWDSETDILRLYEDDHPEPEFWEAVSVKFGIDAGVVQITSEEADEEAAPDSSRAIDPDWDGKRIVSLRMRKASKRPELTAENAMGFHYMVGICTLNMLRHGHAGLLARPEIPKPLTLKEAADRLAEAVRHGVFGESVKHALEVYDRTREMAP